MEERLELLKKSRARVIVGIETGSVPGRLGAVIVEVVGSGAETVLDLHSFESVELPEGLVAALEAVNGEKAIDAQEQADVNFLILHNINHLVRVVPLAPITHRDHAGETFMTEYPVEAEFDMDVAMLYRLYRAVFEPNQLFVFRQVRVNAGATRDSSLHVRAIVSALILER